MARPANVDTSHLEIPAVSAVLREGYERSGLRVGDLAEGSGISQAAIHIAMNGYRYRDVQANVSSPPDSTVVKLASLLRIEPKASREAGRDRAADLLEEGAAAGIAPLVASDAEAKALAAGRNALAAQVFAVFSSEELRAELERREQLGASESDQQIKADLADDLRTAQYPA